MKKTGSKNILSCWLNTNKILKIKKTIVIHNSYTAYTVVIK